MTPLLLERDTMDGVLLSQSATVGYAPWPGNGGPGQHAGREDTSTMDARDALSHVLYEHFYVEGSAPLGYLLRNPSLVPLLEEAGRRLSRFFPEAILRLEYMPDYDDEAGEGELVCLVVTPVGPDDAEARYDRFRDAWWLDAKRAAHGQLVICVAYQ